MKTKDVVIGAWYWTRVGAQRVKVRVVATTVIRSPRVNRYSGASEIISRPVFVVCNARTGRDLVRSAARLTPAEVPPVDLPGTDDAPMHQPGPLLRSAPIRTAGAP